MAGEILTVVVIPLATVDDLIRTRPRLAAEIGESLELKRSLAAETLAELGVDRPRGMPRAAAYVPGVSRR